jgi:hypothetical protein
MFYKDDFYRQVDYLDYVYLYSQDRWDIVVGEDCYYWMVDVLLCYVEVDGRGF